MQLAIWSKCRKPVITAFCLYYGLFTITQSLPRRWPVAIFCRRLIPEFTDTLGLNYRLILFAEQRSQWAEYVYRIYFQNGVVLNWTYPDSEFIFDKQLYKRIFTIFMANVGRSPKLQADTAQYLIRKFDMQNNHPVQIECLSIIHPTPPIGEHPVTPYLRTMFNYAVPQQGLKLDAGVAKPSPNLLDK